MTIVATIKTNKKKVTKRKALIRKGVAGLHLPSLTIKGFRGFKEMRLPEFGQVTLLAGKNSAGKTSVLEAARLFAAAGDPGVMVDMLDDREDILVREGEDGESIDIPDHGSLFFGYDEPETGDIIEIGFPESKNTLRIELANFEPEDLKNAHPSLLPIIEDEGLRCLTIFSSLDRKKVRKSPFFYSKRKLQIQPNDIYMGRFPRGLRRRLFGRFSKFEEKEKHRALHIPCESLGPGLPSNEKITSWYESMELTSEGKRVLDILRFVKPSVELLASQGGSRYDGPRMMVKLKDVDFAVPLKSMGEGIVHLLGLAVVLINTKNGLLLIDEIENGIHYSLFPKLWEFVMQTAQENNVQVIAATHSWDCFKGFAQVAHEMKDVEGRVIRIERKGEETWAVPYSEEEAFIAARSDIEIR